MGDRRMISKMIYDRADFLKLSAAEHDLYTYLLLYTDNDGIVEALHVMRMINASDLSLKLLNELGFVRSLGVRDIMYIENFQDFNKFDRRNFQQSKYRDILLKAMPELTDKVVIPNQRNPRESQRNPNGIPTYNLKEIKINERENNNNSVGVPVEYVEEYIQHQGYKNVEAEEFVKYYADRNWICNGKKISSWMKLVDLWNDNPKRNKTLEKDYDFKKLENELLANNKEVEVDE